MHRTLLVERVNDMLAQFARDLAPYLDGHAAPFFLGKEAVVVVLELFCGAFAAVFDEFGLLLRHDHIGEGPRDACVRGVAETERLYLVEYRRNAVELVVRDEIVDQGAHAFVGYLLVQERKVRGEDRIEEEPPDARLEDFAPELFVLLTVARKDLYFRTQVDGAEIVRRNSGVGRRKCLALALYLVHLFRHPVAAEDDIEKLGGDDDIPAPRLQDVLVGGHYFRGFHLRGFGERHVDRHRVTVEVGVVCGAHQRVHLYRVAFNEYRPECLNGLAVQRGRAVQKHVLVFYRLFKNGPHFGSLVFDKSPRAADVVRELSREKPLNDERAEEFEYHVLRQSAFVEREVGADHDDRAARVVDAFTQEILAEVAVFAFEIIGE